ncbi:protein of unknown function [Kyrpidia spormannii]|uniref:Uncharacterized protein n=1 Tax=Kyrpidia spormannii TaxID=2055160 RepID=A0A6F9EHG2_9BACL|nr:protein of unknown function [Kyrpidia spormannii]
MNMANDRFIHLYKVRFKLNQSLPRLVHVFTVVNCNTYSKGAQLLDHFLYFTWVKLDIFYNLNNKFVGFYPMFM